MQLHLVGGFLGSGKSTAILQAARLLTDQGKRVGIITNEQGKHLVDSSLLRAENLPALEVTGGCFCCHLDDFNERLEEITARFNPEVIFAESVGSCTDLVATVIKPLLEWQKSAAMPSSLSVFTDSRLLLRYLEGQELPFSEGIIYIFEKQIEETGLLVINKIDLLSEADRQKVVALAQESYPHKMVRAQNSLHPEEVADWLKAISTPDQVLPHISLDLDYERYASGEGRFAWLDQEYRMRLADASQMILIRNMLAHLAEGLFARSGAVAHLKCLLRDENQTLKLSLTGMDHPHPDWEAQLQKLDALYGTDIHLLINIMLEGDLQASREVLDDSVAQYLIQLGVEVAPLSAFSRVPGYPEPTMRIGNH